MHSEASQYSILQLCGSSSQPFGVLRVVGHIKGVVCTSSDPQRNCCVNYVRVPLSPSRYKTKLCASSRSPYARQAPGLYRQTALMASGGCCNAQDRAPAANKSFTGPFRLGILRQCVFANRNSRHAHMSTQSRHRPAYLEYNALTFWQLCVISLPFPPTTNDLSTIFSTRNFPFVCFFSPQLFCNDSWQAGNGAAHDATRMPPSCRTGLDRTA